MTTVCAIDPSLTSTGMARITTDGQTWNPETWTRPSKGFRHDTVRDRHFRQVGICADVLAFVEPCELVVVEGPSYGSVGGSMWDRAGLWWRIVSRLVDHNVPVVLCAPTQRRKFATGSGRADKAAVAVAMSRMWPQWEPSSPGRVEDESDSLAMASLALVVAGLPVPFRVTEFRQSVLSGLSIPDIEEAA